MSTEQRPDGRLEHHDVHYDLLGQPFTPPDYTMKQLRDAIPPHCFHPSTLRSMGYAVRDFVLAGSLIYCTTYISLIPYAPVRGLAWLAYTVVQGFFMTGMWILAHECGHGAFSKHRSVNNVMGLLMHSITLNPYHSWRLSHSQHHKATGSMERDTVYKPHTRESWLNARHGEDEAALKNKAQRHGISFEELVEETPVATLYMLVIQQLVGFPAYLLLNVTGQKYYDADGKLVKGVRISHFWPGPDSKLFNARDYWDVIASDLGILAVFAGVWWGIRTLGVFYTFVGYIAPYLWVNFWIVALTFLQHTDGTLPHYTNDAWTFTRGAAATIDRDFGFIGRHLFHGIIETHVLHHYCSGIPFYYADEATEAIKKVMGRHYRSDTKTNFLVALWRNARSCHFVDESVKGSGVLMFRNIKKTVSGTTTEKKVDTVAEMPVVSKARRASIIVSRERRGSILVNDEAVANGIDRVVGGLGRMEVPIGA